MKKAVEPPRWRFVEGKQVACEAAMTQTTRMRLAELAHQILVGAPGSAFRFGGAQLIEKLSAGGCAAGSGSRKDGQALVF